MDPKEIERLEGLLAAATPGPWAVSGVRASTVKLGRDTRVHHIGPDDDHLAAVYYDMKTGRGFMDAKLIVAAVNALPALLTIAKRAGEMSRQAHLDGMRDAARFAHLAPLDTRGSAAETILREIAALQPEEKQG